MANTETSFHSSIAQYRHPDNEDNGPSDAESGRKRGVIIDRSRVDVSFMIHQSVAVMHAEIILQELHLFFRLKLVELSNKQHLKYFEE